MRLSVCRFIYFYVTFSPHAYEFRYFFFPSGTSFFPLSPSLSLALSLTLSLIGSRLKLMQAGTQIAMRSCSRCGFFQKGRAALFFSIFKYTWFCGYYFVLLSVGQAAVSVYETPLTKALVSPAVATPLLGEGPLAGPCSSFLVLVPFSLGSGAAWFSFWGTFCLLCDSGREM